MAQVFHTPMTLQNKENDMNTSNTSGTFRSLSVIALVCGFLGGAFYWWVPLGMVLGLSGLLLGMIDWIMARRRSLDYRLSIGAMALSVATLTLSIVIAALGLQWVTFFGGY
jgi:hypothetical protein